MIESQIYHLFEPGCPIPVYVGQSRKLHQRWTFHKSCMRYSEFGPKSFWLSELAAMSVRPRMVPVASVTARTERALRRKAEHAEEREIRRLTRSGVVLLNCNAFWKPQKPLGTAFRREFEDLAGRFRRTRAAWADWMLGLDVGPFPHEADMRSLGADLGQIAARFPVMDFGHYYRFFDYERPLIANWGYSWRSSLHTTLRKPPQNAGACRVSV